MKFRKIVLVLTALALTAPVFAKDPPSESVSPQVCWTFVGYRVCLI